jgi:GNAT superfamily N-acetyltransferase
MKKADISDIQKIYDYLRPYYTESSLQSRGTFSPENTIATLFMWLKEPSCHVYYIEENGAFGIFALIVCSTYMEEPESDIDMFYVSPEGRGKGISRRLVEKIDQINKSLNVVNCYCASQSAFNDGGKNAMLYTNLFKKFGYKILGHSLAKVY